VYELYFLLHNTVCLSLEHYTLHGGHLPSDIGRGSRPLQSQTMQEEIPIVHRSREKKLEVSCGKKKF